MIKAIIDIGTNSTRVLVVEETEQERRIIYNDLAITRIGEDLGEEKIIKPIPLDRTVNQVKSFVEKCEALGADKIRITATSAIRDAENKKQVEEAIYRVSGRSLEILPGAVEARMSYLGATSDFVDQENTIAVLDIGGGSTELVYPSGDGILCRSVNVGAVRLLEHPDLRKKMAGILQGLVIEKPNQQITLVGVGGTITTLVAMELKLEVYNSELVHGYRLTKKVVEQWFERLSEMSLEERMEIPGLQKQRADIIPYGVAILNQAMEMLGQREIIVSEKDILLGCIETME